MDEDIGIVMKSAVRSRFPNLFPGIYWEWFIIKDPFGKVKMLPGPDTPERETITNFGSRQVTRREAMDYINENELSLVYKTQDGEIYDLPDKPFKGKFPLNTKNKIWVINSIWE